MPRPTVSVVVPAYNAAAFLRRAIDSVLGQTAVDLELLVVDDGSTDATLQLLAGYGERLQAIPQVNAGPAGARNRGLALARGRYIAFLDADDWWLPEKLGRQVALLDSRPEIGFCSTGTRVVHADGTPAGDWPCGDIGASLLETLFMRGAVVSGSTSGVLARRELLLDAGGFDERLRGFEDPDLWIRLAARAGYACIPQPLTVVVRTPGSVSTHLVRMRTTTLASFRKNRNLLPPQQRGAYWRAACAGALADYAKMAWRSGDRRHGLAWAGEALLRAPFGRGRLAAGLLLAMLRGQML